MFYFLLILPLTIPGFPESQNKFTQKDLSPDFPLQLWSLGGILSGLLNIAFYIAAFLAFYFLVWGAFQYILAAGKKEELAKARSRITWALVGLMVVFAAYFIARYAGEIFKPTQGGLPWKI